MTINRVSKVGQMDFGAGPVQVDAPSPVESPDRVEAASSQENHVEQKASEPTSAPVLNGDVRLKFIVDGKTNDVTVLVLDKASRQIIRTIPTDELKNLTQGDLVSIFA
ncbi:MAG: flagellar protein FlaG [Caldiserica bacterium]|nr:flagellar protein FlaG [Caldisericota bacterium]